jgi:hypothetical protein
MILVYYNIRTICLPPTNTCNILRPVKDSLGLKAPGVYTIPCECGAFYIKENGQDKRTHRGATQTHLEFSAVANSTIKEGHWIKFNIVVLVMLPHYTSGVSNEAIKINLHQKVSNTKEAVAGSGKLSNLLHIINKTMTLMV